MSRSVQRALEYNPRMEGAAAGIEAAADGRASAFAAFLPTVTGSYAYTKLDHPQPSRDTPRTTSSRGSVSLAQSDDDVYTLAFNVHQYLFTGFRLLSAYQRALLAEEQAEAGLRDEELTLILEVQEGFLGLLTARDNLRSAQDAPIPGSPPSSRSRRPSTTWASSPAWTFSRPRWTWPRPRTPCFRAQNSVATALARLDTLLLIPPGERC